MCSITTSDSQSFCRRCCSNWIPDPDLRNSEVYSIQAWKVFSLTALLVLPCSAGEGEISQNTWKRIKRQCRRNSLHYVMQCFGLQNPRRAYELFLEINAPMVSSANHTLSAVQCWAELFRRKEKKKKGCLLWLKILDKGPLIQKAWKI